MRASSHYWFIFCIGVFWASQAAYAQDLHDPKVRRIEKKGNQSVYEMTAEWPQSLHQAVDSAGAEQLTSLLASRLSHGVLRVSQHLWLPAQRAPHLQVIAADYEEIQLPSDSIPDVLQRPPAEIVAFGMERRRPAATLAFRSLRYNRETQRLRRYHRVRVRVTYPRTGNASQQALRSMSSTNPHVGVQKSALASGLIFKLPITEAGVYRIDRSDMESLLEETDRSIDDLDPRRLQIFGNSGASLPARAGAPRPGGLTENPIWFRGGSDGSFDKGDALLFYAQDAKGWQYDTDKNRWNHYVNPFANANFYFLKVGTEKGKRIAFSSGAENTNAETISQVTGRRAAAFSEQNWSPSSYGSGWNWVSLDKPKGDAFALLDGLTFPGRASGAVRYRARFALHSRSRTKVHFEADGQVLARASAPPSRSPTVNVANASTVSFQQENAGSAPLDLSMFIPASYSGTPSVAIDWLEVFYPKKLKAGDGRLRWATPPGQKGSFAFELKGFGEAPHVWDVTHPGAMQRLSVTSAGSGAFRVAATVDDSVPHELIAFNPQRAARTLSLSEVQQIDNQNLHGTSTYPDFVIVTPKLFLEQAHQLAERRRKEGLRVLVAQRDQIRNEFAGGQPDMRAARDFFKFLYDRAPQDKLLRYALFFGDGHFNFRNLTTHGEKPALKNHLFPYETKQSFDEDRSYTSDDYFGLLDDNEGRWKYQGPISNGGERVDIGIGRLPVQTQEQASAVLEKIRQYEQVKVNSPWRLDYTFVADDGPTGASGNTNDGDLHVRNIEASARSVREVAPFMTQRKLYGPSYDRQFLSGWRIPDLHRDVTESFRKGTAVFNYSGHGGPDVLAQERILTAQDAASLTNPKRPAIVITATCSFGRWDMAKQQSGAEELLLNPKGGAAALFTTVRVVFTSDNPYSLNAGLNRQLNRQLFTRTKNGRARRIGEAMRITKNTEVGREGNSRKFNLLGDPTMRMAMPRYRAELEAVNDSSLTSSRDSVALRALERVHLKGGIRRPDGEGIVDGFNGRAFITVYDKARSVQLPYQDRDDFDSYTVRKDQIWKGEASVRNGRFAADFRMPKDISYSNEPGRVSIYATSEKVDAGGRSEQVVICRNDASQPNSVCNAENRDTTRSFKNDRQGPHMKLFINDSTFVSGGTVPTNASFIAKLRDTTGLNGAGAGVGHQMLLTIDGDKSNAVNLASFFQTEANSYKEGRIKYNLDKYPAPLTTGPHRLSLTAWDVANNSQTARLKFTLTEAEGGKLELGNVYNVPNPTTATGQPTRFIIEHNQSTGTPAEVRVRIYTLNGRPVRTLRNADLEGGGTLHAGPLQMRWNGRDADGDPLAPGVYLYRVRVAVDDPQGGRQVAERIEKLAVIR